MPKYVIKIKGQEMYLAEDESFTPDKYEAIHYTDFAEAISYAVYDEEVVELESDSK